MVYHTYKHDKILISFIQLEGKTIKKVVVDDTACFMLTKNGYLLDFDASFRPYEEEPMICVNVYNGDIPYYIAYALGFISEEKKDELTNKMHEEELEQERKAKINKLKELINEYPEDAFVYAKSIKELV